MRLGTDFAAAGALMALDARRFRWSAMPAALQVSGLAVQVAGDILFVLTFRESAFLSPPVRVQRERAQTVVTTGPYAVVRHPMYAAFALFACGTALLLGSWWGLLGGLVMLAMLAWRSVREERVLRDELPGYAAYLERVRWRLVPGVW